MSAHKLLENLTETQCRNSRMKPMNYRYHGCGGSCM